MRHPLRQVAVGCAHRVDAVHADRAINAQTLTLVTLAERSQRLGVRLTAALVENLDIRLRRVLRWRTGDEQSGQDYETTEHAGLTAAFRSALGIQSDVTDHDAMLLALAEADAATAAGDVPVGAVMFGPAGFVVGRNLREV